jgi:hypothetical protein
MEVEQAKFDKKFSNSHSALFLVSTHMTIYLFYRNPFFYEDLVLIGR